MNFKGFDYRGIGPFDNKVYLGGNKYVTSTIGYGSSFLFDEKDNINIIYMKTPSLKALINSSKGKVILSIILGFGIATLFRESCKDRNCLVFHAPSMKKIKNKIFSYNDQCYVYTEKHSTCNPDKKVLAISRENA